MFYSTNPYTRTQISNFQYHDTDQVELILNTLNTAYSKWSAISIHERCRYIKKIKTVLLQHKEKAARLITKEMGKPISEAYSEIDKCADLCDYYSNTAPKFLADKIIDTSNSNSWITYEPIGTILGIMPWNYPFWQVFRFVIPTLLAGNAVVVKHALNVPECALLLADIINTAINEYKPYRNLFLENSTTENLIANELIKGVSLTGSTAAGKAVASKAAAKIKPVVLELGGSNALVVFKNATIEKTVDTCIQARFMNNGQSCIAGKRLLIDEAVKEEFLALLTSRVKNMKIGDPNETDTEISVLAKADLVKNLQDQVSKSVEKGAKIILGGSSNYNHFEPTIVDGVTTEMPLFNQETFGPVLSVSSFKTTAEAIQLANATNFGLGVSLFTEDVDFAKSIISQFDDGAVFINSLVKSIPKLPFGGSKTSGIGRELSEEGLKAFVNIKTVVIG